MLAYSRPEAVRTSPPTLSAMARGVWVEYEHAGYRGFGKIVFVGAAMLTIDCGHGGSLVAYPDVVKAIIHGKHVWRDFIGH
jgi:hypothetical protein